MTETRTEAPMLSVTLTVQDDWESDPLRVVAGVREGLDALDEWQRKAVETARQQGRTWDEIGKACGVSRQAAWERFAANG
jgi:DNA-directed RNA polymerase specialized sigma24 family protein